MKNTFTFHIDSGHGWLEVGSNDLDRLGLKESDFSSCSYKEHVFSPTYYLEEDRDADIFIEKFEKANGAINLKEDYVEGNSPIRDLDHLRLSARKEVA
tara:strand:+ start:141 stop:434 length:294 start_codon:yes stop_codon:yes gene_type:complete